MKLKHILSLFLCLALLLDPLALLAADGKDETSSSGGGVTVTVISKLLSEGRLDFKATGNLLLDPKTWTGALGGMAGMALFSYLGQALLPPGLGIFLRTLPRFLGASLGFELGRGNLSEIDPIAMALQVVASTAGYAAVHALIGATAPGWALMVGATLFGVAANLIFRKKVVSITEDKDDGTVAYDSILGKGEGDESEGAAARPGAPDASTASERLRQCYQELLKAIRTKASDREERLHAYEEAVALQKEIARSAVAAN